MPDDPMSAADFQRECMARQARCSAKIEGQLREGITSFHDELAAHRKELADTRRDDRAEQREILVDIRQSVAAAAGLAARAHTRLDDLSGTVTRNEERSRANYRRLEETAERTAVGARTKREILVKLLVTWGPWILLALAFGGWRLLEWRGLV